MDNFDNTIKSGKEYFYESLKIVWKNKKLWFLSGFFSIVFVFIYLFGYFVSENLFGVSFFSRGIYFFLLPVIPLYGLVSLANFFYAESIIDGKDFSYAKSMRLAYSRKKHPFFILFSLFVSVGFAWSLYLLFGFLIVPLLIVVAYSDFSIKESWLDFSEIFEKCSGITFRIAFRIILYYLLLSFLRNFLKHFLLEVSSGVPLVFNIFSALVKLMNEIISFHFIFVGNSRIEEFSFIAIPLFFFLNAAIIIVLPAIIARDMLEDLSK